jgi:hypothetical protein
MARLTYEKLQQEIEAKECKLLTTRHDFANVVGVQSKAFYSITASCGHVNRVKYDMFKAQNCGVVCNDCVVANNKKRFSNDTNDTKDVPKHSQDIEYEGFKNLRDLISPWFLVSKMVEGTLADFAIKPFNVTEDLWMPIQLKVSCGPNNLHSNNYSFSINRDYPDMSLLLFSIADSKIWLLNGNDVLGKLSISIGAKMSKYTNFQVTNIQEQVQSMYNRMPLLDLKSLNVPISVCQQREQEYRRIREQALSFLTFEYPEREGTVYDFVVNGIKVQEKVATTIKKNGFMVLINRQRSGPYKKGDCDMYWINIPDSSWFYLINERTMIDNGCVSDGTNKCILNLILYPNGCNLQAKNKWANEYLFSYDTVTKNELLQIFTSGIITQKECIVKDHDVQRIMSRKLGRRVQGVNDQDGLCFYSIPDAAKYLQMPNETFRKAVGSGKVINGLTWTHCDKSK